MRAAAQNYCFVKSWNYYDNPRFQNVLL